MNIGCKEIFKLDDTRVYSWDLSQTNSDELQFLCAEQNLSSDVDAGAESRRREILAERLLINKALNTSNLSHNEDRAPLIIGKDIFISIAHTRDTLLLAVNPLHPIGIDLEGYRERVLNVRDGFLNDHEQSWLKEGNLKAHVIAWTAKEAIFKAISKRELINSYRNDIILDEFFSDSEPIKLTHTASFLDRRFLLTTILGEKEVFTLAIETK